MLLSVGSTVHFRKIVHFTKMPKNRLVTRSVTNSRPPHMTLNLECTEEPLSEAQLMLRLDLKENYDRVCFFIHFLNYFFSLISYNGLIFNLL